MNFVNPFSLAYIDVRRCERWCVMQYDFVFVTFLEKCYLCRVRNGKQSPYDTENICAPHARSLARSRQRQSQRHIQQKRFIFRIRRIDSWHTLRLIY